MPVKGNFEDYNNIFAIVKRPTEFPYEAEVLGSYVEAKIYIFDYVDDNLDSYDVEHPKDSIMINDTKPDFDTYFAEDVIALEGNTLVRQVEKLMVSRYPELSIV